MKEIRHAVFSHMSVGWNSLLLPEGVAGAFGLCFWLSQVRRQRCMVTTMMRRRRRGSRNSCLISNNRIACDPVYVRKGQLYSKKYTNFFSFQARSQNCEKRLWASLYLSLNTRRTQLPPEGFSWYLIIFQKSLEIIQVSLKSDKNNGYFTRKPMYIYGNISLNSS
jgi:hypothetical protein